MNNTYANWKEKLKNTPDGITLEAMPPEEIDEAFSGNIAFGTGGLRGVMGIGTNRMNRYTIERVTHGFAKTILSSKQQKSVCIAYDTRHNSAEYSKIVCNLLSSYGIAVHIFNKPVPTPTLSFAIRHLKLGWGVCITASHNPQEYNGYKVYDCRGVQLTDQIAGEITKSIDTVEFFERMPEKQQEPIKIIDAAVENAYLEQVISYAKDVNHAPSDFPIVFSALHGTGAQAVPAILKKLGFSPICIQQEPDGSFGGLKTPNPEEPIVYTQALCIAEECGAKLLLATDPDCDRVGIMAKTSQGFELLNGNQIGALLIDYLAQTKGVKPGDTVISTIVSGNLGELVSKDNGINFVRLLTGFKYIGEHAERLPEDSRFFFGYEESYGFLAGDGARDKDAVIASALIVKMAAYYDNKGKTLFDRWEELSYKHGFCIESLHSASVPQNRQKEIMKKLRSKTTIEGLTEVVDYSLGIDSLPPSDVIKLYFDDESWAAIRPSGTEPKLKIYTGVCKKTHDKAKASLESLNKKLHDALEV